MKVETKVYPVMAGEPHLGTQTEHELRAKPYEVEDYLIDLAIEKGSLFDTFNFRGVEFDTTEYLDYEMINDFMETVEGDFIDTKKLYIAADVVHPDER